MYLSSMLAQDLKPNRLSSLKRVATSFIDDRMSDRIGLVIYAEKVIQKHLLLVIERL